MSANLALLQIREDRRTPGIALPRCPDETLAALLTLSRSDNPNAHRALESISRRIYGIAAALTKSGIDRDLRDDCVSEAVASCLASLRTFDPSRASLYTWVKTIAMRRFAYEKTVAVSCVFPPEWATKLAARAYRERGDRDGLSDLDLAIELGVSLTSLQTALSAVVLGASIEEALEIRDPQDDFAAYEDRIESMRNFNSMRALIKDPTDRQILDLFALGNVDAGAISQHRSASSIGRELGISARSAQYRLKNSLETIKNHLMEMDY